MKILRLKNGMMKKRMVYHPALVRPKILTQKHQMLSNDIITPPTKSFIKKNVIYITMYLTHAAHFRGTKKEYEIVKRLTKLSKNLYNFALYIERQFFFLNHGYLPFKRMYHEVKTNENFRLLPPQSARATTRMAEKAIKSFLRILGERKKGNYNRPVRLPQYLPKDGHMVCVMPKEMLRKKGDKIRCTLGRRFQEKYGEMYLWLPLPKRIADKEIKEIRLVPRYNATYFEVHYIYEDNQEDVELELDYDQYLGIDLGLNNFATCVDTSGTSFIIEGRGLKSYNRWWNKQKAKLQSQYDRQGIKTGKKMAWLLWKRKNVMNNYMNQAVAHIIRHCIDNRIGNIVIGELKEIKQNINLGRRNNQNFSYIPFGIFKRKLRGKAERYGIEIHEVDERDTSKTCSVCGVKKDSNRKHRGLYVCNECGSVLNADVNGAINIIRKVAPESIRIGSSGDWSSPERCLIASFGGN